jgi:hypothetical protein
VAHACNPSYSGGRDKEDHSSKSIWAYISQTLSQKNLTQKRASGVAQGVARVQVPVPQKKKKKKKACGTAQVVQGLPSRYKALSSNSSTKK